MRMLIVALFVAALATASGAAPQGLGATGVAGQAPGKTLVLKGATVHPVSGPAVEGCTVVVRDGRIVAVGPTAAVPPFLPTSAGSARAGEAEQSPLLAGDAVVVDLAGRHLYPSLIEADTTLGLIEVGAVRATRDTNEVGAVNPNARADEAFNPDSQLLPVAESAGILVAGIAPRGGLVSGRSAVMVLDGWTREDMALKAPYGLYVRWPRMAIDRGPDADPSVEKQETRRDEQLRRLRDVFENAQAYARGAPDRDVKWEAMRDVVEGRSPVFIEAGGVDEITAALAFLQHEKLKGVLVGCAEGWRIADRIAKAGVPVIFNDITFVPRADYDAYDAFYSAPAVLAAAGVRLTLSCGADPSSVRNLSDVAGRAAAYGLDELAALRAITLSPAQVLGVADRLGTIEVGKDATLFVADGDILDTRTHVLRAWLMGRELDLHDRQKALWEKYRDRPRAAQKPNGVGGR